MQEEHNPVLMVGCGRMGRAIAQALLADHDVMAFDPNADLPGGVVRVDRLNSAELPERLTVLLAIKPQTVGSIAADLSGLAAPGRLFVSIMAGVSLDALHGMIGPEASVVRAMPNTPAAIGQAMTAAVAGASLSQTEIDVITNLFRPVGKLIWLNEESELDSVTAISGSGPAYFFRFAEAMVRAGLAQGLTEDVVRTLVRQTFVGAAGLLEDRPEQTLAEFRKAVTSPGGTTAAGLAILDQEDIDQTVERVIEAAAQRSRELQTPD